MKFRIFISLLTYLIITCTSCKDDEPEAAIDFGPYYLNEAKDYIFFKRGTWWVYENPETLQRDSVVVTASGNDTITYVDVNNSVTEEMASCRLYSYRDRHKYLLYAPKNIFPDIYGPEKPYRAVWFYQFSKYGPSSTSNSEIFFYPFSKEWNIKNPTTLDTIYDEYKLREKVYKDVVVFKITRDFTFPTVIGDNFHGLRSKYYWAPNYGIIKKEDLKNKKHWELVKSHIIQ